MPMTMPTTVASTAKEVLVDTSTKVVIPNLTSMEKTPTIISPAATVTPTQRTWTDTSTPTVTGPSCPSLTPYLPGPLLPHPASSPCPSGSMTT